MSNIGFKKHRLSFKSMVELLDQYNKDNGTDYTISPSYEYYEILDRKNGNRQIVRGTLRDCYNAL